VPADEFSIEELTIPGSMGDPGAGAFAEMVAVRNAVEAAAVGTDALGVTPAELLPVYQLQEYEPGVIFVARLGGRIVARGVWSWTPAADASVSWIEIGVAPAQRNRGIGAALLEVLESRAARAGHTTLQAEVIHTSTAGGRRLAPPTGFGELPADDPGARFLTRHGYRLEQIARISTLPLPADPGRLDALGDRARDASGPDYRVVDWVGPTPERWRAGLAHLRTRMVIEEPTAGLEIDADPWDEARIVARDRQEADSGRTMATVAIEHVPSGALVAFSELAVPDDRSRPVSQEDTLVLPEHRGHRLGSLLKVENLRRLAHLSPGSPMVITFNAEENRHMLDINEAVGFRSIGYEGGWRKDQATAAT
jgi:GNAT superfamily N-acetyltransferase